MMVVVMMVMMAMMPVMMMVAEVTAAFCFRSAGHGYSHDHGQECEQDVFFHGVVLDGRFGWFGWFVK
jgi:hypothetical protein